MHSDTSIYIYGPESIFDGPTHSYAPVSHFNFTILTKRLFLGSWTEGLSECQPGPEPNPDPNLQLVS